MLDDRKGIILGALIEAYIGTGEPVSSQAVLDRCDLTCSSATVRNELAALERDGFIVKPHTSAGRIPTDRGYRYYVDHLAPGPALRRSVRSRIDGFFSTVHTELDRLLKDTSSLLADLTHYPAVVVGPGVRGQAVRDVHLVPLAAPMVLLVLVTDSGRVIQAALRPPDPATPGEVQEAQEVLASLLHEAVLDDRVLDLSVPEEAHGPVGDLAALALAAVEEVADARREVFVGGTSHLASLWEDLASLHRVLAILEREAALLELVGIPEPGTVVRLGHELPAGEEDLAVVSSGYAASGAAGRMGVLGPMRMDYRRTIRVVEEMSEALGERLSD